MRLFCYGCGTRARMEVDIKLAIFWSGPVCEVFGFEIEFLIVADQATSYRSSESGAGSVPGRILLILSLISI